MVPEMSRNVSRLYKDKKQCEGTLAGILTEKTDIEYKIATVSENYRGLDARSLKTRLAEVENKIASLTRERDEILAVYTTTLKQMNEYIRKMKAAMEDALYRLESQNRLEWHNRIEVILKQFDIPWYLDDEGTGNTSVDSRDDYFHEKIREAEKKISDIKVIDTGQSSADTAIAIEDIIHFSEEILGHLRESPDQMNNARMFLSYYLESVKDIISGYGKLAGHTGASDENRELRKRAESLIKDIRDHFEKLFSRMLEKDRIELDTEMEVLEKAIKSEQLF